MQFCVKAVIYSQTYDALPFTDTGNAERTAAFEGLPPRRTIIHLSLSQVIT